MGLIYTNMKIFHFKDKIDSLSRENKKVLPPIHIRIKPTNACNHNCRYCAYRVDGLQLGKDMNAGDYIPKDKILEIIRDLADMSVKAVTFSGGGEPFCYPYLEEAAEELSKKDIAFSCLTNGSRLSGNVARLFALKATWLRISIDGWDGPSYSSYRGVDRSEFGRVMKNMENFKKARGRCHLGVSIIVDRKNHSHIYGLIKNLKAVGADSVKISPCIISNSGKKNNSYHRPIFGTVKKEVSKAVRNLADNNFSISDSYHKLDEKFEKNYKWCPYLQILPVIGADLGVYSCQDKAYNRNNGLIGYIKNRRFRDFWFSGKNKFFKINPSIDCSHHCVANGKNALLAEYLEADEAHLSFV